jgi:nitroimidazol reductase NimA-like FMN-containing flavoprotein (pyridoxamine 5'-phosphate oxidase superfamily)
MVSVMLMPKALAEVQGFMDNEWLACFATVDAHNRPHAVPVWFTYEDGKVHVQTCRKSIKVRNVLKNPYVAVTVYNYLEEAVVIKGRAHVIGDEGEFRRLTQAHIDRYNRLFNKARGTTGVEYIKLDEKGRDSMGIPLFDHKTRCIIEVVPDKILFW